MALDSNGFQIVHFVRKQTESLRPVTPFVCEYCRSKALEEYAPGRYRCSHCQRAIHIGLKFDN